MGKEITFKIDDKNLYMGYILFYYDGPIMFTCKDDDKNYYIAYLTDFDKINYYVAKVTPETLYNLLTDNITMYDAMLTHLDFWLIETSDDINGDTVTKLDYDKINKDILPKKESYLEGAFDERIDELINTLKQKISKNNDLSR